MSTLTEQLLIKMGLRDEPNVLAKSNELFRLLELRSTNAPLQINEYAKIVLIVHIASDVLEIGIDKEQALKLSGLRKSHYATNKRMCEKLLDLNKMIGIKGICIQLGIEEVAKKATELLDLYTTIVGRENADIDVAHPQYAAMAVFYACKLTKRKISKTKLMPYSNLRPTQWLQLEQRWDKFIAKHLTVVSGGGQLNQQSAAGNIDQAKVSASGDRKDGVKIAAKCQVEDYEMWKQRMLSMSESQLLAQEGNKVQNETMRH